MWGCIRVEEAIRRLNETIEKVRNGELTDLIIVEQPVNGNTVVAYSCSKYECQQLLDRAKIIVGVDYK